MEIMTRILFSIQSLIAYTRLELTKNIVEMRLGAIWWLLEPLIMASIYYFLVVLVFQQQGEHYHLFLLTGLMVWQAFSKGLMSATGSLTQSANIVLQTRLPLSYFIVAPILANIIYMLLGFVIILLLAGHVPSLSILYLLPLLIAVTLFTIGLGLIVSILNVFMRDTSRILNFILRAWWFFSPILYDARYVLDSDKISDFLKWLFTMNPFSTFVPLFREALLGSEAHPAQNFSFIASISLVVFMLGVLIFYYFHKRAIKFL